VCIYYINLKYTWEKMYSFEGDFRRKPVQSLRGNSKKVGTKAKIELLGFSYLKWKIIGWGKKKPC